MKKPLNQTSRIQLIREKAKESPKRIVLPEGDNPKILEAASIIQKRKIANIILLGEKKKIEKSIAKDLNIEIIEPKVHFKYKDIVQTYYDLRKHKGASIDETKELLLKQPVYYAALMTRLGLADGFVAGASHTTASVARAAIRCIEIDPDVKIVSSSFVIELENCMYGDKGLFIFSDCGIIPDPTASQLAGIAISSSSLMKCLFDIEPRVALLSYSTKGSAKGKSVDKVLEALKIIREVKSDLIIDGELQLDAAIIPEVSRIKSPESPIKGRANVLVFPNLDAGNICYKLIQRLANARIAGPILQGLTQPASDLSRGCGIEEIIDAVSVTVVRAQNINK